MNQNFDQNSIETNTALLAAYLPQGKMYDAKNIRDTNFNKLLTSFAQEYTRIQEKINELSYEDYIAQTQELIENWESALGIPDDCFTNTVSLTQRQLQCVVKFAQMNIQTEADFIQLAATLGYQIEILHGIVYSVFPMLLPALLGSAKSARFTMIIKFLNMDKPQNVFPMTFPFVFQGQNVMECVFNHLKPANVRIIYWYADYP
jgi:uncharacterized protein YmfQ (DUF2313 family)